LPNQNREDVEIGTIASERGVVLFLVPRDDTPGCTQQACAYRDAYDKFTEAGYDVYCLSADEARLKQAHDQTRPEMEFGL
ncbi:hypothetical protein EDD18DRAFT_1084073, partial [Armillaria luteobubalina]